jgi:uncharacterized protein (DUF849 family)
MHPLASKYKSWRFDWEHDYIASSDNYIFRNTFRDIAMVARELAEEEGVKLEHERYDVGHLYNLEFCIDTGMSKPPVFIQFVLGTGLIAKQLPPIKNFFNLQLYILILLSTD